MTTQNELEIEYVHIPDDENKEDIESVQNSLQSAVSSYLNFGGKTENMTYQICIIVPIILILILLIIFVLAVFIALLPYSVPISAIIIVYKIHRNTEWDKKSYCMVWTLVLMIMAGMYVGGFYMCEAQGWNIPFSVCHIWKWIIVWPAWFAEHNEW